MGLAPAASGRVRSGLTGDARKGGRVKITAGHLGGRVIRTPPGAVRPTQDRVRQSVFSSLGGSCEGWRVLDLYAGSGSLGLEAWSRGAASVLFLERDPRVLAALRDTIAELCPGAGAAVECRKADVLRWLETGIVGEPCDLVLADPPYAEAGRASERILRALSGRGWMRPGGRVVLEMSSRDAAPVPDGWDRVRDRVFGETRIAQYRVPGEECGEKEVRS